MLCSVATGDFPDDQACFARRAVTTSITEAIRAELNGHVFENGFSVR